MPVVGQVTLLLVIITYYVCCPLPRVGQCPFPQDCTAETACPQPGAEREAALGCQSRIGKGHAKWAQLASLGVWSSIREVSAEGELCARHCSRSWGYGREEERLEPSAHGA